MPEEKGSEEPQKNQGNTINIKGDVKMEGGDIVGGDKKVTYDNAIIGNNNIVDSQITIQKHISHIYTKIDEHPSISFSEKEDLKAEVADIQKEDAKGEKANESDISRRLRNIKRMAPEIFEVVLATITNPIAGFGVVAKKVAEKMKAETE